MEGKKEEQLSNLSNSINEITIDWKTVLFKLNKSLKKWLMTFQVITSKTLNEHTNSVNTHFEEMQNKFFTTTSMLEKTESTNNRTAWSQIETTIQAINLIVTLS